MLAIGPVHILAESCWGAREALLTSQGFARHLGDRIAAGQFLVAHVVGRLALPLRASLQRVVVRRVRDRSDLLRPIA